MKLYEALEKQLEKENNFVSDNGEVKKWVVLDKARNFDEGLIELLLDSRDLKQEFFKNIKGTLVFDLNRFVLFLEQKNHLNDSFTKYKNKVGLTIDGKLLKQRNEVALVWPFKDCILEGGQSREEDTREEIFFNEVLARDEITQLLEPKVLTNARVYDREGEQDFAEFARDVEFNKKRGLPDKTITDNLVIKGNNLLALRSLEREFLGKIKLVYIDPPYNTGNDGFKYNDRFTSSTWLTFMLNRLKEAKKLLCNDGVILVQINDHNLTYLKILLDEVLGAENFINIISLRTKSPSGFKVVNLGLFETAEYILMYGKSKKDFKYNQQYEVANYDENYKYYVENIDDAPEDWVIDDIRKIICRESGVDPDSVNHPYKVLKEKIGEGAYVQKLSDFALSNSSKVFRLTAIGNDAGGDTLEAMKKSKKHKNEIFKVDRAGHAPRIVINGQEAAFYDRKIQILDGQKVATTILTNIWTDIAYEGIASEGGVRLKKGKKPEKLLRRLFNMATREGDLILDYHLGSGTTAAVAHKMSRQYIGVEQLDYDENDSVARLKNVIAGDTTGISKTVKWKGGGRFIYLELKKYNQDFMEQIESAKNSESLLKIWGEMKKKAFLDYNVDIKKQDDSIEDFKELELELQKRHLCDVLDKNQLYVNVSSLEDNGFACTDAEKKLTRDFYNT